MLLREAKQDNWFSSNFDAMKKALLSTPIVNNATSCEIKQLFDNVKSFVIDIPIDVDEGTKWFGIMIGPVNDNDISVYIFVDKLNHPETVSDKLDGGVYMATYSNVTLDWNKIFDNAAKVIKYKSGI